MRNFEGAAKTFYTAIEEPSSFTRTFLALGEEELKPEADPQKWYTSLAETVNGFSISCDRSSSRIEAAHSRQDKAVKLLWGRQ